MKCLKKIPLEQREQVKSITLDMANSMYSIARQSFPNALQIIDRFHVQKLMYEALQDLRIQYRWQAMDEENKAVKQAKEKEEQYTPARFDNGDTLKQLLARSRYLLFKLPDKWSKSQEVRANLVANMIEAKISITALENKIVASPDRPSLNLKLEINYSA